MPAITQVINKAQRVLKFQPTDFKEGLKETYKWYLRHHHKESSNYPFEDKLIANAPPFIPDDYVTDAGTMWQFDSLVGRSRTHLVPGRNTAMVVSSTMSPADQFCKSLRTNGDLDGNSECCYPRRRRR